MHNKKYGSKYGVINRLKQCRQLKGYSLRDVAKLTQISRSKINNIEKGLTDPNLKTICLLAEALEIPPLVLFEIVEQ